MDEGLAPSLAQSTVDMQTQESFARWMQYHFPIYAASFNCRVDVDWMDFIRGRWSTFPQALVWAVRALTTLHRGTTQRDEQAIMCARHMYSRGIRHLGSLLQTRAALSDETLAAAILLGGYEVLDGSTQWSWIAHCRGITHLLCARGPAAHRRGIGRTLLLCWRPYIVADAFIHAIPCFLGDHEWALILMSEDVAKDELQRQKGSLLGQTMDYAFVEVAKCPGYLAAAKVLVAPTISSQSNNKVEDLMDDMLFTRENLVQYSRMLETNDPDPSFVGVIPSIHAGPLVQQSRDGLSFAISLVDQLLAMLRAHLARRTGEIPENSGHDSWHLTTQYHTSRSKSPLPASRTNSEDLDLDSRDVQDQLDKFSLTMGLGSLLPDACGCPQFAAHKSLPF
ncbi:hypothetical protein BJY01DRAFT_215996 [Aspergillus pseudoustus]|uniref:Transcription factor domain-containing protein n=1 Tax=Aspergillus pseudoustus TaxID=1810923 RepID=A0ABR4JTN3_9EURO